MIREVAQRAKAAFARACHSNLRRQLYSMDQFVTPGALLPSSTNYVRTTILSNRTKPTKRTRDVFVLNFRAAPPSRMRCDVTSARTGCCGKLQKFQRRSKTRTIGDSLLRRMRRRKYELPTSRVVSFHGVRLDRPGDINPAKRDASEI